MPAVIPYFMIHPKVEVTSHDAVPATFELQCTSNGIDVSPDQDENTTETFCGTYTTYKPSVWTVTLTALQSFGTDGLETLLRPLVGQLVDLAITPNGDDAVSVDNPIYTAVALVKDFSFMAGNVGEASEFDVVFAVQGAPTIGITAPAGTQAQSSPEPEPEAQAA